VADIQSKLTRCFTTVFPDLPVATIPTVSQTTLTAWDSIASITLINVIEEEFSISMDFELLPELTSFERIATYLAAKTAN
jgi:acyl carrier protein